MSDEKNCIERKFSNRSECEQKEFLQHTWCNTCMEVDLGMKDAKEFQADNKIWIEGNCVKCNDKVITEIEEE